MPTLPSVGKIFEELRTPLTALALRLYGDEHKAILGNSAPPSIEIPIQYILLKARFKGVAGVRLGSPNSTVNIPRLNGTPEMVSLQMAVQPVATS